MVNVTLPQASVAVPVLPLANNQAAIAPPGSAVPSHSKVKSVGSFVHVGAVVSFTVKTAVRVVVLPQSSVAVKVIVLLPVIPQVVPSSNPL